MSAGQRSHRMTVWPHCAPEPCGRPGHTGSRMLHASSRRRPASCRRRIRQRLRKSGGCCPGPGHSAGGGNPLQMSICEGSPLGGEMGKQARSIAELPGLQGMKQAHQASWPQASCCHHSLGLPDTSSCSGIKPIEVTLLPLRRQALPTVVPSPSERAPNSV